MSRSTPLDTLIEISRKARDQAGKVLADDRRQHNQSQQQLATLLAYRQDYAEQLQALLTSGVGTATLGNYQQFLDQLDRTIAQARASIEQQGRHTEKSRQHWLREQRQLTSFDTLAQRRAAQALYGEARREQQLGDEISSRLAGRNPSPMSSQE